MLQKAVIYCRVSSPKQVTEGHGLASQETRCREYAAHKNYNVQEVFRDEGLSGKLLDRPNMQAMLSYLKKNRHERMVVIIDDISRLARDIETHIQLRSAISAASGKLESPSIEFGDDSDSKLVEHLLASVSAHQREKNAEQVLHRMRARMQGGYWVFQPPAGYRFDKQAGHGKILVRDEPYASLIAEALENFASGRFETQCEVKRFLEASVHCPKDGRGEVHYSRIRDILTKPVYAGYLDKPEWGLSLVKGKHEALISYETYQKIQERLNKQAKVPARANINEDFPLRGFVTCACCKQPMSGCWSKGRNASYPYYLCQTKGCDAYGKSVRKEKLESEFEALLGEMKPSQPLFFVASQMFTDLWNMKRKTIKSEAETIRRDIIQIDRKTGQFFERILETESQTLITAYENQIRKLEEEKIRLDENIAKCGRPLQSFDETFRTAMEFLGNPLNLWRSERLEHKRAVLKLAFEERLPYDKNKGFRTPAKSQPFAVFEGFSNPKSEMVGDERLELPTSSV